MKLNLTAKLLTPALCIGLLSAAAQTAQAHYLWSEIDANEVHVALAEGPVEAGVAFDKVKNSVITADGVTLPLLPHQDTPYMAATLPTDSDVVGIVNNWGVLDRTEQGRGVFLLYYYAKAARSLADAAKPAALPTQWYAKYQDGKILARFVKGGVPVANAPAYITLPGGEVQKTTTDESGKVLFDATVNGMYGLRATLNTSEKGSYQGKEYPGIHTYSTLTFPITDISAPAAQD